MNLCVAWKMNAHIIYVYISSVVMNLFIVVEDEYTYYLQLYILGHETFCCVEDECTNYLRLYILDHEHICCHGR